MIKIFFISILLSASTLSAFADEPQNLGTFPLQLSTDVFDPAENTIRVDPPQADTAFADFTYSASATVIYVFSSGSGAYYHCDKTKLVTLLEISEMDSGGNLLQSFEVPFGQTGKFQDGLNYKVRFSESNLKGSACEFLQASFFLYPSK